VTSSASSAAYDDGRVATDRRPVLDLERQALVFNLCLLLPAVLVTTAFVAWPIVKLFQISLHELRLSELMRPIVKPITLANYERALLHPDMPRVAFTTAVFTVASTAMAFLFGMATALALGSLGRGRAAMQTALISPWAVAPVIASVVWMLLLDERFGLINAAVLGTGLASSPVPFLSEPDWALLSVTLLAIWKEYPFFTVMMAAALQSVPRELYEAARLDGAGPVALFRYVTWPLVRPVAVVAIFLATMSAFRNVETIMVMTGGGPARSTETLALRVYTETFRFLSPGTGAALGVVTLLVGLLLAAVFWPAMMRKAP
jgi:multiple sugar transport system permease protein